MFTLRGRGGIGADRVTSYVAATGHNRSRLSSPIQTDTIDPTGLAGNGTECSGLLRLHTDSTAAETRSKQGRNNGKGVIVPCPIVVSTGEKAEIPSGVTGNVIDFPAEVAIMTLDGWQHPRPSRASNPLEGSEMSSTKQQTQGRGIRAFVQAVIRIGGEQGNAASSNALNRVSRP